MAKDYKKGDDYKLYLDTANSWDTPTWVEIKAASELTLDRVPADVEVPERGEDTGHLHGKADPVISFTLLEDAGDANVETLIAAIHNDDNSTNMVHLAVSRGDIATATTKYWHMEAVLLGAPLSAGRGEPASYDVEAKRHANSDHTLTRETVAS